MEYHRELAYLQVETARALTRDRRATEAIKNYRLAIDAFEQLSASDPSRITDNYRFMTSSYKALGELLQETGSKSEAAENFRKSKQYAEKWLEIAPDNVALRREIIGDK